MGGPSTRHMFGSFTYMKTVDEIVTAVRKKIEAVKGKVSEREARIVRLRAEYGISDVEMISLLSMAGKDAVNNRPMSSVSYNLSDEADAPKVVAAGVVQNLMTERSLIEDEKESITRLGLIARNLKPTTLFTDSGIPYVSDHLHLSEAEIDFLGF